jgi:F-type H+-transporting ATPase subunit alpha
MLGRVVDPIGNPMDEGGTIVPAEWMPVERAAPRVVDRQPVCVPLYTGMKVIDALVPIGRGQRELIIGDRGLGKTSIGVDTILAQKGRDVSCVYCAIGQKASTVREVVATFERFGALEYTAIVVALPDDPPSMRYLAPYCACAMAEYFMYRGGDALVVLDDLSKHAVTYREISALLERPVGREAYPGDIFYLHSRLLERAAHLAAGAGGGSLTAIPIVETLAGDISAYIPTNVISICDGQIVLDAAAFNEGSRPALDAGLSVSRVGGSAQVAALRRVAGRLRIDLAQYEEMARFVKFGAEVDAATRAQLRRGARARELLKQPVHRPMSPVEEVAVLFAVTSGLLDKVAVSAIARAEEMLLEWVASGRSKTLAALAQSGEMDADTEAVLADEIGALIASAALETVDETSDAMVNV